MKNLFFILAMITVVLSLSLLLCSCSKENMTSSSQNTLTISPLGTVEQTSKSLCAFPPGSIVMYPASMSIPSGWVSCDGVSSYTGANNQTLVTPDLNSSSVTSAILPQIAKSANYIFIVKSNVPMPQSYNIILSDMQLELTDTIPTDIIVLADNSSISPYGWTTETTTPGKLFENGVSTSFFGFNLSQSQDLNNLLKLYPYQQTLDFYNSSYNASSSEQTNDSITALKEFYGAVMTAGNDALKYLRTQQTSFQTMLNPLTFIKATDESTLKSGSAQMVIDNNGNLSILPVIPNSTIILWNDADSPPDSSTWQSTYSSYNNVTWSNTIQLSQSWSILAYIANYVSNGIDSITAMNVNITLLPSGVSFYRLA